MTGDISGISGHNITHDLIYRVIALFRQGNIRETQYFQAVQDKKVEVSDVLEQVYIALTEKGYNPVNQIVGYIMSGDPTYITSHKGARSLIMKVERDEILEELMAVYIDARLK